MESSDFRRHVNRNFNPGEDSLGREELVVDSHERHEGTMISSNPACALRVRTDLSLVFLAMKPGAAFTPLAVVISGAIAFSRP